MNRELLDRALSYLARREHSRLELLRKLRRWAEPAEIEEVLDECERLEHLSDRRFARQRAEMQRTRRLWGNLRLRLDLRARGVNARIIEEVLEQVEAEFPEHDYLNQLIQTWLERFGRPSDAKRLKRLFQHCRRKGFSGPAVRRQLQPYFRGLNWTNG